MTITWFDAHLDLAYLAVSGRDMTRELDTSATPHPPAAVTLPSLINGGVRFALATIFTEPVEATTGAAEGVANSAETKFAEPQMYRAGDAARAHAVGRAQLEAYLTWRDRGLVRMGLVDELRIEPGTGEMRGGMGVSEVVPPSIQSRVARLRVRTDDVLRIGILMENADPIRTPDELGWWRERGVVAIGLAWARASRYAGGNGTDLGLSDLGRALVREMDRLGVVHDVSHLSDRALRELFEVTDRPVIASHSNCRALLDQPGGSNTSTSSAGTGSSGTGSTGAVGNPLAAQRHVTDDTIREIGRRGGVIGLNLFSKFLVPKERSGERAMLDDCVAHVEHVCELMGHRRGVGLGSDMDGGFGANALPRGIESPRDLTSLAEALRGRGWTDDEVRGFACENWIRFFLERRSSR